LSQSGLAAADNQGFDLFDPHRRKIGEILGGG
jgi:hypothetical protein